jgi:hypothetical protein
VAARGVAASDNDTKYAQTEANGDETQIDELKED